MGPAFPIKSLFYPLSRVEKSIGDLTNTEFMHIKCPPVWGLGFYVNHHVLAPIVPGRGVVGHYIDRCITMVYKRKKENALQK